MQISSPIVLSVGGADLNERISGLPATPGALCLEVNGQVTYLSSAPNLQRRITRMVARLSASKPDSPNLAGQPGVAIQCWESGSQLHTSLLLYELARRYFPDEYRKRVHLRLPWFVALLTRDAFPRLIVANRIASGCEPVIGPFRTRDAAQLYEEAIQGAFALRRCLEVLTPNADHPGCIYGEMKQCLRPCQGAVDSARYLVEASAVCEFLLANGSKMIRELTNEREQAIAGMDFESAARIHKRLEKLNIAKAARDVAIGPVEHFHGVALVPENQSPRAQVFPMRSGRWQNPFSVERSTSIARQMNQACHDEDPERRDTLEDLALFTRWYYSSWREGIWVPFARLDASAVRKIERNINRLLA